MAPEPAYVAIAGKVARQIRSGELRPGTQLPSYPELADEHGVSEIVIRQSIGLLRSQDLVRSVRRRGTFVAERSGLVRVSPERQTEPAETSFQNDRNAQVRIERDESRIAADEEIAEALGITAGTEIRRTVTRTSEDGDPASISDTYEPLNVDEAATTLEETVADRPPSEEHRAWLGSAAGELVRTVRQRFLAGDRVVMLADVTYPRDRYDAMVFRMELPPQPAS